MNKWARMLYQPNLPLEEGHYVTASKEHIELSLQAAEEGMVLLKNEDNILPLAKGTRVALFGKGSFDYVKGGGGSGDVYTKYIRNLYEGMKATGRVSVYEPLSDFYRDNVSSQYKQGVTPGMAEEPKLEESLVKGARNFCDTAVISISRFSGEGWDRSDVEYVSDDFNPWGGDGESLPHRLGRIFPRGDFYLSGAEQEMINTVCANFPKVVVVLNVGGLVDTSWFAENAAIRGALLAWQAGMEGGLAAARILTGLCNPSGKLPDTFARHMEDYPSTAHFHDSFTHVDYSEDIYVGYRYFETIEGAAEKVVYPFGYGLSYTDFMLETTDVWEEETSVNLLVRVTNVGRCAGKEVVQVYYEAPQGKLGKPRRALAAFEKTDLLMPGESRTISILIEKSQMASYDDLGKVAKSAYVLEAGEYKLYIGTSVSDALELCDVITVERDVIVEQLAAHVVPTSLKERLLADGTFEELPQLVPVDPDACAIEKMKGGHEDALTPLTNARDRFVCVRPYKDGAKILLDVYEGRATMDEFVAQLSDDDVIHLVGGQPNLGVANTWGIGNLPEYGVVNAMTADGPAGIRINPECGVCTTAWPCATLLASTWNTALIEQVGAAAGAELKENNLGVWLAPAMNIHRNPMCGRNFEYYSEDPYLTGKIGAAMVKGIQSNGVAATIKHFACNNKETNRKNCDSRVSERALREIYLKGFEIVVKEAKPWALMTAYNIINGYRASECKELITDILRGEWGYAGLVMSDWWTKGEHYKEILAGNDLKMATGYPERVREAMEAGAITRADIEPCAKRVLEFLMKLD